MLTLCTDFAVFMPAGAIFALLGAQTCFFLRNQEALGDFGVRCRQALQQVRPDTHTTALY